MQIDKQHLIARGRTTEVYQYNSHLVVKLFFGWCPPEWAAREARIANLVHSRGLPVPRCEGLVQYAVEKWLVPVAAARLSEEIEAEREPILAFLTRSMGKDGRVPSR